MKYTKSMRINGEMACRSLSDKAFEFYNETDPFTVYEYEDGFEEKLYAYSGCFGEKENLTFDDLQNELESLADAVSDEDEELNDTDE